MLEFITNLTECVIWSDAGKCFQCPGNEILEKCCHHLSTASFYLK